MQWSRRTLSWRSKQCRPSHHNRRHVLSSVLTKPAHVWQGSESLDKEMRETARGLLGHLARVSLDTKDTDPYPDCAESELLLALAEGDDGLWGLPSITLVDFIAGETIAEDVTVVDRDEERSLTLGSMS